MKTFNVENTVTRIISIHLTEYLLYFIYVMRATVPSYEILYSTEIYVNENKPF